jgi:hypothetical protein
LTALLLERAKLSGGQLCFQLLVCGFINLGDLLLQRIPLSFAGHDSLGGFHQT